MASASDIRDTLLLLVPGFVALKIFAWRSFQARRTDLEWTIWSVLVAAVINGALSFTPWTQPALFFASLAVAVVLGIAVAAIWEWWVRRDEGALAPFAPRAWDKVLLPRSRWVQVRLKDGATVRGRTRTVAESAGTDDLDLYLEQVEWVLKDGTRRPMTGVEGLLVERSEISRLQILRGKAKN